MRSANTPNFTPEPNLSAATDQRRETTLAVTCVLASYLVWGIVGWFFQVVTGYVPPVTLLAHRVIWSLLFLCAVLAIRGELGQLPAALKERRTVLGLAATSLLIATNWMTFIYSAHKQVLVAASVGYFLSPLMNVVLGVTLLGERLRRGQVVAILLAAIGVGSLVLAKGGSVWIPLILMTTWSLYALLRKRIAVGPVAGLAVETLLLAPLAAVYIAYDFAVQHVHIVAAGWALLGAAGVVTAMPLILFGFAARRLSMASLGLAHYLSPTVQFIVATVVLHEPLSTAALIGFAFIWLGLIVFTIEGYRRFRRSPAE